MGLNVIYQFLNLIPHSCHVGIPYELQGVQHDILVLTGQDGHGGTLGELDASIRHSRLGPVIQFQQGLIFIDVGRACAKFLCQLLPGLFPFIDPVFPFHPDRLPQITNLAGCIDRIVSLHSVTAIDICA